MRDLRGVDADHAHVRPVDHDGVAVEHGVDMTRRRMREPLARQPAADDGEEHGKDDEGDAHGASLRGIVVTQGAPIVR